jgi:uncharacterized protein YacL
LYFDKRLKVSEFLHKFSGDISDSISEMANELVSNIYKTVGIILGVVIAFLVDPKTTPTIIFLASLLYLGYIVFILIYLLPSSYLAFRRKYLEYGRNKEQLSDILLKEEIEKLQGNSLERARYEFLVFFALTNLGYALLGTIAYFLASFFKPFK